MEYKWCRKCDKGPFHEHCLEGEHSCLEQCSENPSDE
jgi:hypothetical protein